MTTPATPSNAKSGYIILIKLPMEVDFTVMDLKRGRIVISRVTVRIMGSWVFVETPLISHMVNW
jgi:hypothetical protein